MPPWGVTPKAAQGAAISRRGGLPFTSVEAQHRVGRAPAHQTGQQRHHADVAPDADGAHGGDHAIYPDCRPVFADALDKAIRLADWHEVCLERPFVGMDKTGIVRRGFELRVPLELTWSCYVGGDKHCGKCGTCVERKEAFLRASVKDPTSYVG